MTSHHIDFVHTRSLCHARIYEAISDLINLKKTLNYPIRLKSRMFWRLCFRFFYAVLGLIMNLSSLGFASGLLRYT